MIHSAIELQHPIIAVDSNYPSLSIGEYAQSQGYDVHVFAPSFGESKICNPLDFLINSQDAETAQMLATSINRYFWRLDKDNSFFSVTGEELTQALLMLAREFGSCADILTAATIIKSENIIQRLMNAELNPWIKQAFVGLFMYANSPRTAAGIIAYVRTIFSELMVDKGVGWFIGKSTLPLEVKERQMIILGMTSQTPKAVTAVIWSIFDLFLNRYLNSDLIVACDEESFHHLSKHNYQQPIISLPKEFNQENRVNYVASQNNKTISIDLELAKRIDEVEQRFPLIKL